MYKPKFNKVLVEINDEEAKWGSGNDDSMLGASYREGKIVDIGTELFPSGDYKDLNGMQWTNIVASLNGLVGKTIMWHEGHEAGTVFEENGKKYGLIFWWDIIGVKDEQ